MSTAADEPNIIRHRAEGVSDKNGLTEIVIAVEARTFDLGCTMGREGGAAKPNQGRGGSTKPKGRVGQRTRIAYDAYSETSPKYQLGSGIRRSRYV